MNSEKLANTLNEIGFECSLEPSQRHPEGRILLFLGNDGKQRDRSLEITMQEQILGPKETDIPYFRIQFETALPFPLSEVRAHDVGSFVFYLNRQLELPGFELDEGNSLVLYRYVLLAPDANIQPDLLKGLIGSITLTLDLFSEAIEKVSTGETTFNKILESILKMAESLS